MKKCKSCKMEIDEKASKCPHCQTDQRNWFRRHPIISIILMLMVIGIVGTSGSGDKSTKTTIKPATQTTETKADNANAAPAAEPAEATTKQYVKVFEAKGTAGKKTESFELQGGKQKLTYSFTGKTSLIGGIYVMKEGTSKEEQGGIPEVMVSEAGSDTTILRKPAGTYYIDIGVANASWTVTLEEER